MSQVESSVKSTGGRVTNIVRLAQTFLGCRPEFHMVQGTPHSQANSEWLVILIRKYIILSTMVLNLAVYGML